MPIDITKLKMPAVSPDGITAMQLIDSDNYNMSELCKIISNDPALTSTLIKYANSSRYRQNIEVSNINRAVTVLGIKALGAAIIVASMRSFISPSVISQQLWKHSQSLSSISKLIAKRFYPQLAEEIELPALVHDIGALVLATNYPNEYREIISTAGSPDNSLTLSELEQEAFGMTHDDVTAAFISSCRLPEITGKVLANFHHRLPFLDIQNNVAAQQTVIINIAHLLEEQINSHTDHIKEVMPESMESLLLHLGLTTDDIENFLEDYDEDLLT